VAIVEAVAETMRGDVDELDKKAMDKLEDLLFLATEVRNAATGIEVVSNDNVSRPIYISLLLPMSCLSFWDGSHYLLRSMIWEMCA
jgi:hypothetical protein